MDNKKIADIVLSAHKFEGFNPVQLQAIKRGLFEGKNLVVSAPTASGKTLVCELAAINTLLNLDKKVVYTGPLKALASEHYETFKDAYSRKNIKVNLSIGDKDSSEPWLEKADWIVSTYEKLDSLIRHRVPWLHNIGLLVIDEIHTLDSDRGPTVEILITKLRKINPKMQILALSATIPNSEELAKWLDAEHVHSTWRPVTLSKGIIMDSVIKFDNKDDVYVSGLKVEDSQRSLIEDTLRKKKQALIFRNSRRNAQASAKKMALLTERRLTQDEKLKLNGIANEILNTLESPTAQCKILSDCVRNGSAFHTAGLVNKQRKLVEMGFKKGLIKIISATPTLAAGINLPSSRVIMPELMRYTKEGMVWIPVGEYLQMCGRAGRPQYDSEGEAICIASSPNQFDRIWEGYITGKPEDIFSKLGIEPILRTHILSILTTGFAMDVDGLKSFLASTFYAHQYKSMNEIYYIMNRILKDLDAWGFIEQKDNELKPTRIGMRVSELYLDPESAHALITELQKTEKGPTKELGDIFTYISLNENSPWLRVSAKEESKIWGGAYGTGKELYSDPITSGFGDYSFLDKFKLSLMIRDWIHEKSEEYILENYNVAPGILRAQLLNIDWLIYAGEELAKLLELKKSGKRARELRIRVKYGINKELMPLIIIKGIGRVRARRLYANGVRTPIGIRNMATEDLARLIGKKTAENIKQEVDA